MPGDRHANVDGERAAADRQNHALHLYDDDAEFLSAVGTFAVEGLAGGDAVVVVATGAHLRALGHAIERRGLPLAEATRSGLLVLVDAGAALERFMVDGAPDRERFARLLDPLLDDARAAAETSHVRVAGEMVDVLWSHGDHVATLRLEHLWSETMRSRPWCTLLCTYRLGGFASPDDAGAFREVCELHGPVVPSTRYNALSRGQRVRHVADLERRARILEREIERRRRVEGERARLFETESKARAEFALLYRVTDTANRAETLEQVYETALEGIGSGLGVDRASILLFDPDGVLRFKAWRGLSDEYRAAVEGHSPWRPGDKNPMPVLIEDVRTHAGAAPFLPALEREGVGALGFFPLFSRGRLKGKFMVYYRGPHAFTDEECRVASAIASQIAFAVSRKLASLERDRFVGIVGHDLRNPLSAITMSAAALMRHELSEASNKLVRRVVRSAQRMDELIAELLDFAQARDTSGFRIQPKPADAADIARRVLDELEAGRPGSTVSLRVEGDPRGEWDADRIEQVLSNLVANAIQHGGGTTVEVRIQAQGDEVVFDVHNGGDPIPPAALPGLFDPFRRGGSGSRESHLGLGLFIAREIVRAHGGTIEVASTAEAGTTFSVRLPRCAPQAS